MKRWKMASLLSLGTTFGALALSRYLWLRSQALPGGARLMLTPFPPASVEIIIAWLSHRLADEA